MAEVALSFARESTHASIDSATGLPSDSGLTFAGLDFDECSHTTEIVTVEKAGGARRSTAEVKPTVGLGGGVPIRRGTVTITRELEMAGANTTDETFDVAANVFDAAAVATVLNDAGAPGSQSDLVATAGDAGSWTPTAIADIDNGSIVGVVDSGKSHSIRITGRAVGEVIGSPALPFTPLTSHTFRQTRMFYAGQAWSSETLAIRYDGRGDTSGTSKGQRLTFFGCKLSEVAFTADDAGRVTAAYTFSAAYVEVDNANAALDDVACACADGMITATAFDGTVRIADDHCGTGGTLATPANAGTIASDTGLWAFKMTTPIEGIAGTQNNNIGHRGWRVGAPSFELMLPSCVTNVALDDDQENKAARYITIDAGTGGEGLGFSIHMNGILKSDPLVFERTDTEHTQTLTFQSAPYCNDTTTAPASAAVNSYVAFAWWL